jgi:hypothetical protein
MIHVPKSRTHAPAVIVAAYNNVGHLRGGGTPNQLAVIVEHFSGGGVALYNLLDIHTHVYARAHAHATRTWFAVGKTSFRQRGLCGIGNDSLRVISPAGGWEM